MSARSCVVCGKDAEQRHHISYDPEMCIDLCIECHMTAHNHGTGPPKKPKAFDDERYYETLSDEIIKTIGLQDSGFSIEMRVRSGKVRVVEVNGRLGWDDGVGDLFQLRTPQERIFQAFHLALGLKPELVRDVSRFAAVAYRSCYYDGIVEELPVREELAQLEHDELKLGLATHKGARFVAPPNPDAYPHVVWALATHPASSHAAYKIARQAVDGLDISIRRL